MSSNDSKSYLIDLNKLVDQYDIPYHHFIGKKPINADYSVWLKKLKKFLKLLSLKLLKESELLKIWIFLVNVFIVFINDSVFKTNPWTYKIKDLNGEKIILSFCKKEVLLRKLQMSYYPEPDSHIRDKVKVAFEFSN